MKLTNKYIRNQNLKLQLRLKKKKNAEREKKFIKSELKQDKLDVQVSRESDIKKVQDVFVEVKEEEPLNVENFFMMTMTFLTVKRFLMQKGNLLLVLLTEQILLPMLKNSLKNLMCQKWKLFILKRKKIEKKEEMSIDDDENRENASIENSLMKK